MKYLSIVNNGVNKVGYIINDIIMCPQSNIYIIDTFQIIIVPIMIIGSIFCTTKQPCWMVEGNIG